MNQWPLKRRNPKFIYLNQDNWRGNFRIKYYLFYFKNKTIFSHFTDWEPFWLPSLFTHKNTPTRTHTQTHAHPHICPHTQHVNRCSILEEVLFYVANCDMFLLVQFSKSTYNICWFFLIFLLFLSMFFFRNKAHSQNCKLVEVYSNAFTWPRVSFQRKRYCWQKIHFLSKFCGKQEWGQNKYLIMWSLRLNLKAFLLCRVLFIAAVSCSLLWSFVCPAICF